MKIYFGFIKEKTPYFKNGQYYCRCISGRHVQSYLTSELFFVAPNMTCKACFYFRYECKIWVGLKDNCPNIWIVKVTPTKENLTSINFLTTVITVVASMRKKYVAITGCLYNHLKHNLETKLKR